MEKELKIVNEIVENKQIEINDVKKIENSIHQTSLEIDKSNQLIEEKLANAIYNESQNFYDNELLEVEFEKKQKIAKNKKEEFQKEFYEYLRKQSKYIF